MPGERYERVRILYDGSWATFKTCLTCVRIWEDLCSHGPRQMGGLEEMLLETNGLSLTGIPIGDE